MSEGRAVVNQDALIPHNHSTFISVAAVTFPVHMFVLCLTLFQPKVHKHRLSVWNKLCYAVGGAPYQITGSALGFFLQIYLLDVAQVTEKDRKTTEATLPLQSIKLQSIPFIAILLNRVWVLFFTHSPPQPLIGISSKVKSNHYGVFPPLSQPRIRLSSSKRSSAITWTPAALFCYAISTLNRIAIQH